MSQAIGQRNLRSGETAAAKATVVPGRHAHTADMLDRLTRLRKVLPAMGQELATARREAAKLRIENGRLRDRLHSLEAKRSGGSPSGS
jgi:chromosome segregation ATPase